MILILITYLAGALTILSPCILPVLPFVFSRAQQSFVKSGLPLLAGMILTFAGFSVLAIVGGELLVQVSGFGRTAALVLFTVFGISLIFPRVQEFIFSPFSKIGMKLSSGKSEDSWGSSFFIGAGTGLLWAPCAGPILGLVLTGAAVQGNKAQSFVLLLAYALGSATSLALALLAGKKVFGTMKKTLKADRAIRSVLGVAILLGVASIAFGLDRTLLTQISKLETTNVETKLLAAAGLQKKAIEGAMPELEGATVWLNSGPLMKKDLQGKVVLIDFWTYSCINCLRTLPYVKAWAEKYKSDDFVVIGIHAPEFAFEKNIDNVKKAVQELGLTYPIALDNDFKIWEAFQNSYWPAHYFIDRQGQIRRVHSGEGDYEASEQMIRRLLTEDGRSLKDSSLATVQTEGIQVAGASGDLSPETYVGYDRAANFASTPVIAQDQVLSYQLPGSFQRNQWGFQASWKIEEERAVSDSKKSKLVYRFYARDLHLVLGSAKGKLKFQVRLDGKAPAESHGLDIDAEGHGVIDGQRLYQLIRLKSAPSEHLFEIEFEDSGAEVYAFTFG